ncbi:MAG TPA: hypothetical protein VG267_08520 [Terracidiphilus sp.]|jgi:hypothetical protein|nr:hypothetical protein [Terracidiphilus sp.]
MRAFILAVASLLALPAACAAHQAPLPDPLQLMNRALANEKKMAAEQERYECRVTDWTAETDKNGKTKKQDTEVKEQFFVNGQEIEHTLQKNGKDLTPDETRKEDQRVMKETVKYSDKAKADKETAKNNQQAVDMISAMMLTNGHRERVNGRSVLLYDIVPNPHFKPKNLMQHFASVMQGKVGIDEETGELIDLNIKSVQDVKIAGGVIASLHKGFWLHIHSTPQADGVWLNDLAEGTGDARAALFFHPYFRFRETTGDCHLYNATAQQVGQATVVKK